MRGPAITAQTDSLQRLKESYAQREIVLCLGAGVSQGSRVPDWKELLYRIGGKVMRGEAHGRQVVDQLAEDGLSLPAIAGILEAEHQKRRRLAKEEPEAQFSDLIREALYRETGLVHDSSSKAEAFVKQTQRDNPTLRAVGALCVIDGPPFKRNPKVRAVINFNYDALFYRYTRARYRPFLLRTIERPEAPLNPNRIPVYHPHGFLHFSKKYAGNKDRETPDQLVLTEQEYFDRFNRPLTVFTYTMLFLLREHPFLFLGCSLNDENVRRLLHYSLQERLEGIKRREKRPSSRAIRHFMIRKRERNPEITHLVEASLKRLGVRIVWINDYADIGEVLGQVYEAVDGRRWGDVY